MLHAERTDAVMHDQVLAASATGALDETRLIERYGHLVKRIARHLMVRLPGSVHLDDLQQAGMLGLLEAAGRYDGGRGASFETYASIRVRGAMLDEVRRGDWAPRSIHRNVRRMAEAVQCVEARTGREAHDKDIASAMGVTLDEYNQIQKDLFTSRLFSYESLLEFDEVQEPATDEGLLGAFESQAFRQELAGAIGELPEREQRVLFLYCDEGLNLKQVGAVMGVSESRVSQIMSQARSRLRDRLADWLQDE